MQGPVTIYDVAKESGVSIATVSRVMNHPERVAPATRERILSVMTRLAFSPSIEAGVRARSSLRRIAVVAPFAWSYSVMERIRGLSASFSPLEYEIITYSVEDRLQLDHYLTLLSTGDRADGVVMISLAAGAGPLRLFRRRGIPLVQVEQPFPGVPSIVSDNREGGTIAARLFLEKGFGRPAFMGVGGAPGHLMDSAGQRLEGFSAALKEGGVLLPSSRLFFHSSGRRAILAAARELFSARPRPDALFAASDYEAMVVCAAAREAGITVPGDLAILGYDNIEASRFMGLSTIDQRLEESGRLAARVMLASFREEREENPELIRLPVALVARESV